MVVSASVVHSSPAAEGGETDIYDVTQLSQVRDVAKRVCKWVTSQKDSLTYPYTATGSGTRNTNKLVEIVR